MEIIDNRKIVKKPAYDVIVVGGGVAGVSAAVSAARNGSRVLLMEKSIVLGGLATSGLISWYEPLCDGNGTKMISGITEELIKLAVKYGFSDMPEEWKYGDNTKETKKRYVTHYSPTIFAMALDEYLAENGVTIVLDCLATNPANITIYLLQEE